MTEPKTPDTKPDLNALLPFASPRQSDMVHALIKHGSMIAVAEALGVTPARVRSALAELRQKAARRGFSPAHDMTKVVPDGFHIKGVSTYYDQDGKPRGQWVKSQKDRDHELALLLDAVRDIAEPFARKSGRVRAPKQTRKDLLCVYPMGDPHLGMFSWAAETGHNFDLKIAESNLVDAVDQLVNLAPPSEEAMIINLGDFFHTDSKENRTLRSSHALDVDSRWAKVLAVGIRAMRRCIDRALEKHRIVHVICEIGNHDDHSAVMLALCLQQYYENNKRVRIDTSPDTFHWFRFGSTLIGVTHGHGTKPDQLPGIMACDRRQDWGETTHRYFYTGHIHHDTLKEFPGCIVETFRTLAPQDAWSHTSGYRSGQDMKVDVIHRRFGRVNRHIVGIQQIWDREGEAR